MHQNIWLRFVNQANEIQRRTKALFITIANLGTLEQSLDTGQFAVMKEWQKITRKHLLEGFTNQSKRPPITAFTADADEKFDPFLNTQSEQNNGLLQNLVIRHKSVQSIHFPFAQNKTIS
jgi:hypothetical protein